MAGAIPAAPAVFFLNRYLPKVTSARPRRIHGNLMCDASSADFASVIALGVGADSLAVFILPATNSVRLPKPEPRAAGVHFVVPSIYSGEVTRGHRSGVGDVEDALQPLDFGNGLFGVHP